MPALCNVIFKKRPDRSCAVLQVGLQALPIDQTACRAEGLLRQVATQGQQLTGTPLASKKMDTNVIELVRLVKDHCAYAWQKLSDP
jgi:hypothetical protein